MELGVLFAEFLAIEEEQHRAPIGLTDETGDDAHDGGDDLEEDTHGLLNGLAVLIHRRVQVSQVERIRAPAPGKIAGGPHHCSGHKTEDDKEDYPRNNRGGEDVPVFNRTKPPPIRVHAHEHGAEEQEDGNDGRNDCRDPRGPLQRGGWCG